MEATVVNSLETNSKKIQSLVSECHRQDIDRLFPLSYSAMMDGISCPAKLNFSRISCKPSGKSIDEAAAKVGTFNHRVAQLCIQNSFILDGDIEALEYDLFWPQNAIGFTRKELLQAQDCRDELEEIILKVHGILRKFKLEVFTEPTWGINKQGTHLVSYQKKSEKFMVGKLDLAGINNNRSSGVVLDYKTHAKKYQDAEELWKQLLSYVVFIKLKFPQLNTLTVGAAYIKGAELDVVKVLRSPEAFQNAFDEYISFIEEFINNWGKILDCVAIKNPKCKWCSYRSICPAFKK